MAANQTRALSPDGQPGAPGRLGALARQAVEPKPRRRRRPEEAEREILEAAAALLAERPSHEVTVSAIMSRTTLSRKSFYVYFRDRHDLITTLVTPLRAELDQIMARWRENVVDDPRGVGRATLLAVATIYVRHGALLRALAEASNQDEEAGRAWHEFTEPPTRLVARTIQDEIARGRIAGLEAEPTARALVGMNLHSFFEQLVGNPKADVEAVVDTLVEIWMRTLYGTAPPR
jgi:TetR/AcrR family transcriptional regulator, ethionamide resistance regulator